MSGVRVRVSIVRGILQCPTPDDLANLERVRNLRTIYGFPKGSQSWLLVRLTDVRKLRVVVPFLLAYQGWAKPWPIDRGYSAVADPVDVPGTVPSKFVKLRLVSQRPCLEPGVRVP